MNASRTDRRFGALLGTALVWMISFIGVGQVMRSELLGSGPAMWGVAALPAVTGILMLLAYERYLRVSDELQRRILLEALALGFGVGIVALCGYPVLERAGAPSVPTEVYVVPMALFYLIGYAIGCGRYR